MGISSELISEFVKITNDTKADKQSDKTVYGTIKEHDGSYWVQLDGSDLMTPISTTTDVKNGERVMVMIKNHTATVTGNVSSPSAQSKDVQNLDGEVKETASKISEFEIVMAYSLTADNITAINATIDRLRAEAANIGKLEAVEADIETLSAKFANLNRVTATDIKAITAELDKISAIFADFEDLSTEDLEAVNAEIGNLKAYTADFTYVFADELEARDAKINDLEVNKLSVENAKITYVNIDFSNIDQAQMTEFYAKSGLIDNVTINEGTITGTLVGVTIKGDLIEGGTIVADKLVIQGDDGLYYKLNTNGETIETEQTEYNSLNGSIITAKSVTAEKISVQDLVAFGATIGGFHITDHSIYSGVKGSVDNTTKGAYLDNEGQINIGDTSNFIKFHTVRTCYKVVKVGDTYIATDEETPQFEGSIIPDALTDTGESVYEFSSEGGGVYYYRIIEDYKLEISAESILFGSDLKSSVEDIRPLMEHIKIGTYIDPETGNEQPSIEMSEGDTDFKQVITNTSAVFMDGSEVKTKIDTDGVESENVTVKGEFCQNGFVWTTRPNGNYRLMWKG